MFKKCCVCFSDSHLTAFCPQITQSLFLPMIDYVLIKRFMMTLNAFENYFVTLSSQKTLKFAAKKSILSQENCNLDGSFIDKPRNYQNFSFTVFNQLCVSNYHSFKHSFVLSKKLICMAKMIKITDCEISAQDFLYLLLSPTVTSLECLNLKLSKSVKLEEVLRRIPNIQNIQIVNSDVMIEDSWIKIFEKYVNMKKCEIIKIDLKFDAFNAKQIAEFLDTKCMESMELTLHITDYPEFEFHQSELHGTILKYFKEDHSFFFPTKPKLKIRIQMRQLKCHCDFSRPFANYELHHSYTDMLKYLLAKDHHLVARCGICVTSEFRFQYFTFVLS